MLWLYAGQSIRPELLQDRVHRELSGVDGGRRKLVKLRGPAALRILGDLVLKVGDRRRAGEHLAVVEGDTLIAR